VAGRTEERRGGERGMVARRPDHRRLTGCFVGAIVVAPFLALIFGLNAALLVMAIALSLTTYLVVLGARSVAPAVRGRMVATAILNGVLALLCVIVLIVRLV